MKGKFTSEEEIRDRGNFPNDTRIFKKYNNTRRSLTMTENAFSKIAPKGKIKLTPEEMFAIYQECSVPQAPVISGLFFVKFKKFLTNI